MKGRTMPYTVRITLKDAEPFDWEDNEHLPSVDELTAREEARNALMHFENIISAEPILMPIPKESFYKPWQDAVAEFGVKETFELLDNIIKHFDRETREFTLTLKVRAARMKKHPGFKLLYQNKQDLVTEYLETPELNSLPDTDIRAIDVDEQVMFLMRKLASTLAADNGFEPISKNAKMPAALLSVVFKLRSVFHPTSRKEPAPRAVTAARRAASQAARLATQPPKGDAVKKRK